MFPQASPLLGGLGGAAYVGQTNSISATTLAFPAGALAGHLALVIAAIGASVSGWTKDTSGNSSVHWKLLTAADISSPPAISSATNWGMVVYAGPTIARLKSITSDATDPYSFPGFNKDGGPILVSMFRSQNVSPTRPAGWTARQTSVGVDGFTNINTADLPNPSQYTNGATLDWTGSGSGTIITGGFVHELL